MAEVGVNQSMLIKSKYMYQTNLHDTLHNT